MKTRKTAKTAGKTTRKATAPNTPKRIRQAAAQQPIQPVSASKPSPPKAATTPKPAPARSPAKKAAPKAKVAKKRPAVLAIPVNLAGSTPVPGNLAAVSRAPESKPAKPKAPQRVPIRKKSRKVAAQGAKAGKVVRVQKTSVEATEVTKRAQPQNRRRGTPRPTQEGPAQTQPVKDLVKAPRRRGTPRPTRKAPAEPTLAKPAVKAVTVPSTGPALTQTRSISSEGASKTFAAESAPQPAPAKIAPPETAAEIPSDLPAILLEGDEPVVVPPVAVQPESLALEISETADLPSTIGAGKLWLTARDPHCLYATWTFSQPEQQALNQFSMHHHLVLRCRRLDPAQAVAEIHLHPESQHWFIPLEQPGGDYVAELGFYGAPGQWRSLALSPVAQVPRPMIAAAEPVRFVRVDPDLPLALTPSDEATRWGQHALPTRTPSNEAPLPRAAEGEREREAVRWGQHVEPTPMPSNDAARWGQRALPPAVQAVEVPSLAPQQEQALQEIFVQELRTFRAIGSLELEELLRTPGGAQLLPGIPEMASQAAAQFGGQPGLDVGVEFPSSLSLAAEAPGAAQPSFWFQVNAEVTIYGATEPNARVTIAGRPVALRPDGSFTFRFALPDGQYALPVTAESAHGDCRQAALRLSRSTSRTGEVGVHPQNPALRPPVAESIR